MNKQKGIMFVIVVVLLLMGATSVVAGEVESDLAKIRALSARYHRPDLALADGWGLVPGLDHCWENPGVGAMGYHYINRGRVDTNVNMLEPETFVYAPGPNGKLQLAAVEYVVPGAAWDAEEHAELPSVMGQSFHYAPATGNYILHAWVWRHNPAGMFEDWNPNVSCP